MLLDVVTAETYKYALKLKTRAQEKARRLQKLKDEKRYDSHLQTCSVLDRERKTRYIIRV